MLFCGLTGMPVTLLSAKIDNVLRKSFCAQKLLRKTLFLGMRPSLA